MGRYWKIVNFENQIIMRKEIFNKQWGENSPKAGETAIILDVLGFTKESTSSHLEGELIFINHNKFLHDAIKKMGESRKLCEQCWGDSNTNKRVN